MIGEVLSVVFLLSVREGTLLKYSPLYICLGIVFLKIVASRFFRGTLPMQEKKILALAVIWPLLKEIVTNFGFSSVYFLFLS